MFKAEIVGRIDPEVLEERIREAREGKEEAERIHALRMASKLRKREARREERRVMSGKFNSIKKKEP